MMDPPPAAIMAGTPYLHPNATPLTLMSSVVSQIDASVSVTEPSWLIITPALLYRTCRPPKRSTAAFTIASASASSDASEWTYEVWPPPASISAATASPASSATSVRTTDAPSLAKSLEATIPMPLAPPVMSATFPSSRPIVPPSRVAPSIRTPVRRPGPCDEAAPIIEASREQRRTDMATELLLLGGERTALVDGATSDVIEPGTGQPMARVSDAGAVDARRAVDIAHRAFEEGAWPRMSATERGRVLLRASALLRERLDEFAVVESRNAGKPINAARGEIGTVANVL